MSAPLIGINTASARPRRGDTPPQGGPCARRLEHSRAAGRRGAMGKRSHDLPRSPRWGRRPSGHLDVADDHVRVEVVLPWLLQRFAEVAQAAIKHRGQLLLTKRS